MITTHIKLIRLFLYLPLFAYIQPYQTYLSRLTGWWGWEVIKGFCLMLFLGVASRSQHRSNVTCIIFRISWCCLVMFAVHRFACFSYLFLFQSDVLSVPMSHLHRTVFCEWTPSLLCFTVLMLFGFLFTSRWPTLVCLSSSQLVSWTVVVTSIAATKTIFIWTDQHNIRTIPH